MAAKNRIYISVTPELEKALEALAEATGAAKASIAGEMLEQSLPAIVQMTKVMNAAKNKQADTFELLNEAVFTAVNAASQLGLEINDAKRGLRRFAPGKKKGEE
jgi:predicted DNA-binding protein